jgi:hypothetical protein
LDVVCEAVAVESLIEQRVEAVAKRNEDETMKCVPEHDNDDDDDFFDNYM